MNIDGATEPAFVNTVFDYPDFRSSECLMTTISPVKRFYCNYLNLKITSNDISAFIPTKVYPHGTKEKTPL